MDEHEEFHRLLSEIQAGSDEAVQQFLDRYGQAILQVIRARLDQRLRSQFDSIDFLQDMWASFYRCPPPPAAFAGPEELFRYLTALARNKVVGAFRKRVLSPRHNVNLEVSQEDEVAAEHLARLASPEPSPSQAFSAKEQFERAVRGRDQLQARILSMLRDGHTHAEVSAALGLSEKRVQRLVRKVSKGLNS